MWCLKCFRKHQDYTIVVSPIQDNKVFQDWIFLINDHNESLQIHSRHIKADTTNDHAVSEQGSLPLRLLCNGRAIYADKRKIQVGRRPKYGILPSLATWESLYHQRPRTHPATPQRGGSPRRRRLRIKETDDL